MTKAKIRQLCAELRDGATLTEAADAIKVSPRTIQAWRKRGSKGEPGDELYVELAVAYDEAVTSRRDFLVQRVRDGRLISGERDWKASAWLLERLHPDEFSRRTIKETVIRAELESLLDAVEPHMSREAYGELIDALAHLHGLAGGEESAAAPGSTRH